MFAVFDSVAFDFGINITETAERISSCPRPQWYTSASVTLC